jgi:predicted phage tail protein
MIRDFYLHGSLGDKYGEHHRFEVSTIAEFVQAMFCFHKDFIDFIANDSWLILSGRPGSFIVMTEDMLDMQLGNTNEVHISPSISGSGGGDNKGVLQTVAGAAIAIVAVAASVYTGGGSLALYGGMSVSYSSMAMMGGLMMLGGVSQLIAKSPKGKDAIGSESKNSFILGGVQNVTEEGACLPVQFGRVRYGGIVVSAGLSVEQINAWDGNVPAAGQSSGGISWNEMVSVLATVNSNQMGTIKPDGGKSYRAGTDVVYSITPSSGCSISDVKVDGSSVGAVSSYTFTNIQKTSGDYDHTIHVTFSGPSRYYETNMNDEGGVFDGLG